jgi:energy-coupling factor transporter ATP-binding protein EcfA2
MGIEVENVSFSYPDKKVLKNVNFKIENGEFVGLVGPTGCGKTTLAYCLNGLIPNSIRGKFYGKVTIEGLSTTEHKVSEIARNVGLVFQDPDWQIFNLTIKDEVAFSLKNLKMDKIEKRIKDALKIVGLNGYENEDPNKLSQGQKQKLCIASVVASKPKIIILDEPTSQLDYKNTEIIHKILKKLNKMGTTVLIIEHDTDWITKYADRVLIMNDGTIVDDGSPDKVFSKVKILKKLGIKIPRLSS